MNVLISKSITGRKSENFALIWAGLDFLPFYSGKKSDGWDDICNLLNFSTTENFRLYNTSVNFYR